LYGSAFKAPSPLLLYAKYPILPGDIVGNLKLKSQYVHTLEGQVIANLSRHWSLSSDIALNLLQNKAEFTLQGVNKIAQNVASMKTLSWETQVDFHYLDRVMAYASFELDRATRDLGQEGYQADLVGSANVLYPSMIVRAGAQIRLREFPIRLGIEGIYAAARRSSNTNSLQNGAPYNLPSYVAMNGSISTVGLHLFEGKETTISIAARNILGTYGPDAGFSGLDYPLAPRMFSLSFRQVL
jgi:iron complex outermembrane receptor protein